MPETFVAEDPVTCDGYITSFIYDSKQRFVGFDCEWARKGKISLIQIATWDHVILIRIKSECSLTPLLVQFLEDRGIVKFGVNISRDAEKLKQDFRVQLKGFVDLRCMGSRSEGFVNTVWKKIEDFEELMKQRQQTDPMINLSAERLAWMPKLGLSTLTLDILGETMNKAIDIRAGDWECGKLTDQQKQYAAFDASAALKIAYTLKSRDLHVLEHVNEADSEQLFNMVEKLVDIAFNDKVDFHFLLRQIKKVYPSFLYDDYVVKKRKTVLTKKLRRRILFEELLKQDDEEEDEGIPRRPGIKVL